MGFHGENDLKIPIFLYVLLSRSSQVQTSGAFSRCGSSARTLLHYSIFNRCRLPCELSLRDHVNIEREILLKLYSIQIICQLYETHKTRETVFHQMQPVFKQTCTSDNFLLITFSVLYHNLFRNSWSFIVIHKIPLCTRRWIIPFNTAVPRQIINSAAQQKHPEHGYHPVCSHYISNGSLKGRHEYTSAF